MGSTTIKVQIDAKGTITGLAPVNNGLKTVSNQAKQTQSDLQKALKFDVTATIPGLKTLQGAVKGVGDAFTAIKIVAAGGLIGSTVLKGIGAAVDASVELQNALIGVDSVARSFGQDADAVKKAVLDFTKDGLVPATDAALAFKQILSTGTALPDAIKLLNSLKDTAAFNRQSFYSLGEAIVATTEGIKNGNSVRADAVGVTKNLSVLEKEYAASLGKTVAQLTDQEKVQARVLGFIREGAFASGDAAKLLDTYSGSVSQLNTAFTRFLANIGDFITKSSIVKSIIGGLAGGFDFFAKVLEKDSPAEKLAKLSQELIGVNNAIKLAADSGAPVSKDGFLAQRKIVLEAEIAFSKRSLELKKQESEANAKAYQDKVKTQQLEAENIKTTTARLKLIKTLDKEIKNAGLSEIQILQKVRDERLKLVGPSDTVRRLKIEQDYQSKVQKLQKETADKELANKEKIDRKNKQIFDALIKGASNPFESIRVPTRLNEDERAQFNKRALIGRGVGVANSIVGGAQGAKDLVAGIAGTALDAFIPGLGQAAGPLLKAFTEGPDAVRGMVKEFTKALPDVVQGFIEAAPVFIEELARQTPVIIERLSEKAPDIIAKLVESAPRVTLALTTAMPKVALKFVEELIKNIPRIIGQIGKAIVDAIKSAVGLGGGSAGEGGGVKGFLTSGPTKSGLANGALNVVTLGGSGVATKALEKLGVKFAHGGEPRKFAMMAQGGSPFQDSIQSKIQSGELVVDYTTTKQLKSALNDGFGNKAMMAQLSKIADLLSGPQQISTSVMLKDKVFADIILNLNRTGQRLA